MRCEDATEKRVVSNREGERERERERERENEGENPAKRRMAWLREFNLEKMDIPVRRGKWDLKALKL